ncbi:MAG: hypothetical protein ACPGLV_00505 [Bacteroidia bacterium]
MKNLPILLSFALALFVFSSCAETDLGTQVGNAYCDCTEKYEDLDERNECLVKVTEDYKVKQEALSEEERKTVQQKVEEVSAACMGGE